MRIRYKLLIALCLLSQLIPACNYLVLQQVRSQYTDTYTVPTAN